MAAHITSLMNKLGKVGSEPSLPSLPALQCKCIGQPASKLFSYQLPMCVSISACWLACLLYHLTAQGINADFPQVAGVRDKASHGLYHIFRIRNALMDKARLFKALSACTGLCIYKNRNLCLDRYLQRCVCCDARDPAATSAKLRGFGIQGLLVMLVCTCCLRISVENLHIAE